MKLNDGEIVITLNGEDRVLKPTLNATRTIARQFGGLRQARQAIVDENLDGVVFIIRQGLGLTDKEARSLPDEVYATGMRDDLLVPLLRYVAILGNGGKPLPDDPGAGSEAADTAGN